MNYKFHDKIVIRTPLKPLKISFSENEILSFIKRDDVVEALYLSSPELLKELDKIKTVEDLSRNTKLKFSALKYIFRMHTRSTPFGLFAGIAATEWINDLEIDLTGDSRSTRLDMVYTFALSQYVSKLDSVKSNIKFYTNSSAYTLFGNVRYIHYYYENDKRVHQLCEVVGNSYLTKILSQAKNGATVFELAHLLISTDVSECDAIKYIHEIIKEQLLVSEIDISLRGKDPFQNIIEVLDRIYDFIDLPAKQLLADLKNIVSEMTILDLKVYNKPKVYEDLLERLNRFEIPTLAGKIFQTDLIRKINAPKENLRKNDFVQTDQKAIIRAAKILNKLGNRSSNSELMQFQQEFFKRFEYREVSLNWVLDNESGIGYGKSLKKSKDSNPLIEGLKKGIDRSMINIEWDEVQSFLLKKLVDATLQKKYVISIEDKETFHFPSNDDDLPKTMSLMFSYLNKSEQGNLIYLKNIGAPSGINLLGRFSTSDAKTKIIVDEIASIEKEMLSGSKIAHISHLPESRAGNILFTPNIREYEIPYLCYSSYPLDRQISVNDLLISIRNNRIYLRSDRDVAEVIPRLDNAHNFASKSLPIYHFLCDLQTQGLRNGLMFDWGRLANLEFIFFPRVKIGNIIVSPATWKFKKSDLDYLFTNAKGTVKNNILEFNKWKSIHNIPDLIVLVDRDNELLINLKDEISVELFFSMIPKSKTLLLREFLFEKNQTGIIDGNGSHYANEIIATLISTKQNKAKLNGEYNSLKKSGLKRKFSPGSEWLYYKVYCGVESVDKVLLVSIKPLIKRLIKRNLIKKWFFIRYSDHGNTHIRIRMHISENEKLGEVIQLFSQSIKNYVKNELIWKVELDTYVREIERYGLNTMELSEEFFYTDSDSALRLLEFIDANNFDRWELAICYLDTLLTKLGLKLEDKVLFIENLKLNYVKEFNLSKKAQILVDRRYRNKKNEIMSMLDKFRMDMDKIVRVDESLVSSIKQLINPGEMPFDLTSLFSSFIHMSLNRLFRADLRVNELVTYDFLWRYYKSKIEMSKSVMLKKNYE